MSYLTRQLCSVPDEEEDDDDSANNGTARVFSGGGLIRTAEGLGVNCSSSSLNSTYDGENAVDVDCLEVIDIGDASIKNFIECLEHANWTDYFAFMVREPSN